MLQVDYEHRSGFPISTHVTDNAESIALLGGSALLYRFDDSTIGFWWPPHGRHHDALMPLVQDRAVWNRMGKHWHVHVDAADVIVHDLRHLAAERGRR